jgi:hypothetical protein
MREVELAVRACPPYEVPSTVRGVPPLRYLFKQLSTAGKGLLPGAIALRMTASGTVSGKKRTQTSRRALVFTAAAASAGNLKRRG